MTSCLWMCVMIIVPALTKSQQRHPEAVLAGICGAGINVTVGEGILS